jgi:hypothetical protein
MENKITLEQLTTFIQTKTDLTIANFQYNESSIDSKDIIILQANYDNESYNAVCDNNADSLLKLLATIILGDEENPLRAYLFGEDSEIDNVLNELANENNQSLSLDKMKEKIAEAILEDLNS